MEFMAKKKSKKKTARKKAAQRLELQNRENAESRTAEVATVAWMLTTFATLLAVSACVGIWLLMLAFIPVNERAYVAALPTLMLVIACVTAVVAGALTVAAHYLRKQQPPRGITVMAVGIVASPYLLLLVLNIVAMLR